MLDTFVEEPLPASSPLWSMDNVVVTPHAAGEMQFHERDVVDILLTNIGAPGAGIPLKNQIVWRRGRFRLYGAARPPKLDMSCKRFA